MSLNLGLLDITFKLSKKFQKKLAMKLTVSNNFKAKFLSLH